MNEEKEKRPLPPLIQHLVDAMERKGLTIAVGLQQQGHIPTIEKILDEMGSTTLAWERIGKEINWVPQAACRDYVDYLREQIKKIQSLETNSAV